MSHHLRLHPAAQRELAEATAYYEAESAGLGDAFLAEAEHAFSQVASFPEAFPVSYGHVRVKVLAAFPAARRRRARPRPGGPVDVGVLLPVLRLARG